MSTATTEKEVIEEVRTKNKAERKVKEMGPRFAIGVKQSEGIYLFTYGKDSSELLRVDGQYSLLSPPKFTKTPRLLEAYVSAYRDGILANQDSMISEDAVEEAYKFRSNVILAEFVQGELVWIDFLKKAEF